MRKTIALCLALAFFACRWSLDPKPRHRIIVFADLTMSLTPDAADTVQNTVNAIVDDAPGGTQLYIIPICENTQGVRSIVADVPSPGITKKDRDDAMAKRATLKIRIAALFSQIRGTHAVTSEYASCISPGLRIVDNLTRADDKTTVWKTDAVFVSDMIEECRASVLGQPVRLKLSNHQFADANRFVNGKGLLMNLRSVRAVVILPRANGELKLDEPLPTDLQSFWEHLFARSGVIGQRVWWDADPSQYIASLRH